MSVRAILMIIKLIPIRCCESDGVCRNGRFGFGFSVTTECMEMCWCALQ